MYNGFNELIRENLCNACFDCGALIESTVLEISNSSVILDIGLKSEAKIKASEFFNEAGHLEISVGDKVVVVLEKFDNGYGETVASREKAKILQAWAELEEACRQEKNVFGVVNERIKGGYSVDMGKVKGFLPISLVDTKQIDDPDSILGENMELRIIKVNKQMNNVIVSRRAVMLSESSENRQKVLDQLQEGDIVTGIVKAITAYGAFIDLGGVDGLLHLLDMSWRRIRVATDIMKIGDTVTVKVLKFDKEKNRIALGMKQLQQDPWQEIKELHPIGSKFTGKVTNIVDYGCFVEVEAGIEGLLHTSEIDWIHKNIKASKLFRVGDEVEVMILEVDDDKKRIALGMKQCKENPWKKFAEQHMPGVVIEGTIHSVMDFGIFVSIEGGIDGLVHMEDISWNEPGERAVKSYRKEQHIDVVVLCMDINRGRVSLGIKQVNRNVYNNYISTRQIGSIVNCKVLGVNENHIVVDIVDRIIGIIRLENMGLIDGQNPIDLFKQDDEIKCKILELDPKYNVINMSICKDESVSSSNTSSL